VDEFQDANFAQVKILQKFSRRKSNVSRWAIPIRPLSFSCASSAAFGFFSKQFPEAKLVVLEKNGALRPRLGCAYALISKIPIFSWERNRCIPYKRRR